MATIAEIAVPPETFPLGRVFAAFPSVSVELERVVPTESAIVPYAWVTGADEATAARIVGDFEDHPEVGSASVVDEVDGEFLLRVEWLSDYNGILRGFQEADVSLLSSTGTAEEWAFEIRSTSAGAIADFRRLALDLDIPVEVRSVHDLARRDRHQDVPDGSTDPDGER